MLSPEQIVAYCQRYKVSAWWLLTGKGPKRSGESMERSLRILELLGELPESVGESVEALLLSLRVAIAEEKLLEHERKQERRRT